MSLELRQGKYVIVDPRYDNEGHERSDPTKPIQPLDGTAPVWYGGPISPTDRGPAGHTSKTPLPSESIFNVVEDQSVEYIAQLVCRARSNFQTGSVLFSYYYYSKSVNAQGKPVRKFYGKPLTGLDKLKVVEQ